MHNILCTYPKQFGNRLIVWIDPASIFSLTFVASCPVIFAYKSKILFYLLNSRFSILKYLKYIFEYADSESEVCFPKNGLST